MGQEEVRPRAPEDAPHRLPASRQHRKDPLQWRGERETPPPLDRLRVRDAYPCAHRFAAELFQFQDIPRADALHGGRNLRRPQGSGRRGERFHLLVRHQPRAHHFAHDVLLQERERPDPCDGICALCLHSDACIHGPLLRQAEPVYGLCRLDYPRYRHRLFHPYPWHVAEAYA